MCLFRRVLSFWVAVVILGLMAAGSIAAPAASAAGPVVCAGTVTRDLVLDRDLLNCPGDGLRIGADNITINLNGHILDGTGTAGSAGIGIAGHSGITVKGGSIREFERGVVASDAPNTRVVANTIAGNVADGVLGEGSSSGMLIQGNRVSENGAFLPEQKATSAIEWADGLDVRGDRARIIGNTVSESRDDGIDASGPGAKVVNNLTTNNGAGSASADGIDIDGIGTLIQQNTATGNGDDGIGIGLHAERPTIRNNTASNNHDYGIQATPDTVDGGGNKARGNGAADQCEDVTCSLAGQ
jgi:parallel beta-helix repeat protein